MLYELPILKHIDAESVDEALFWLHHSGEKAKVISGGTDLLNLLKDRVTGPKLPVPKVLVNIKPVREMSQITYDEDTGLSIGSTVTLNRLETSAVIKQNFNVLLMASRQVGTTQIRNMGTVGGNICQRPQCMYFRHPHFTCFKKGGAKCFAITGEHRDYHAILAKGKCVMAHPSDMAIVLIALKAKAIIASRSKVKDIPLEDFFVGGNHLTETVLESDELVREILVPKQKPETYSVFLKHRTRHAADFALVSVTAAVQIVEGFCRDTRIVIGGIAPFPYLVPQAEEIMRENRLSRELISRISEVCVEQARPLPMNHYKKDLAKALVKQALESIQHEAKSLF